MDYTDPSDGEFFYVCGHGSESKPLSDHKCEACATAFAKRKPQPPPLGRKLLLRFRLGYDSQEAAKEALLLPVAQEAVHQ